MRTGKLEGKRGRMKPREKLPGCMALCVMISLAIHEIESCGQNNNQHHTACTVRKGQDRTV